MWQIADVQRWHEQDNHGIMINRMIKDVTKEKKTRNRAVEL